MEDMTKGPFAALADPTRREIVETLGAGEITAGDLAQRFPMSHPAISHHLRILREAGLVHVRSRAQQRLYSLNPVGFNELGRWLAHMERFWRARMNVVEENLRNHAPARSRGAKKRRARKRRKR
jgi:DNA-binding transcriptional ArsR family regulator